MGFEDSMIEEGFHDEEEYLEHLLDNADREFEHQHNAKYSYYDEYDWSEYYDYEDLQEQYQLWARKYPLKHKLFLIWFHYFNEYDYNNRKLILEKYSEWMADEIFQILKFREYYGENFPRLYDCVLWEEKNWIEEILRQANVVYIKPLEPHFWLQKISLNELIRGEVNDIEVWLDNKNNYERSISKSTDDEKKLFLDAINKKTFQNDITIQHVRQCILEQLGIEKEPDFIIEEIMEWFDEDVERGRNLIYNIKCVQNFCGYIGYRYLKKHA